MTELYAPRIRTPSDRPSQPAIEPTTGTEIVRAALKNFNRKCNMAGAAQELGVTVGTLEDFAAGRRQTLPVELMKKLVERLWHGHHTYNAEFDALESTNKTPPAPPPVMPDPFVADERCIDLVACAREPRTLRAEVPEKDKPRGRPGWLGTLFG